MFKLLGNKQLFFLLLGLIIFIAIMGLTLGKREKITWVEKFVGDTVSFTQGLLYKPAGSIAGFFEDVGNLRLLYEENQILKSTLNQYARDTVRLNALEAQNERLKSALEFTERQKQADNYKYHIAEIVGENSDPFNKTLRINLGEKDGIKENMAVMTTAGLIGRIVRVTPFYANVQLISDIDEKSNSTKAISVTTKGKESDSFGIIEGYDSEKGMLLMTKIEQDDPLKIGDTIVTSGMGEVYPKGLVVGTVQSIETGKFGITRTAMVKPAATFHHLLEVFVVEVPEFQ